jgi:hypothetical protein
MRRQYTDEQRAEALALSLTIGPLAASKRLGIPPRTVASWRHPSHADHPVPAAAAAVLDTARSTPEVVARLWDVLTRAIDTLETGLRDPQVRLGDVARATDVLLRSHALLSGRPTENVNTNLTLMDDDERRLIDGLTPEKRHIYRAFLEANVAAAEALAALSDDRRAAMGTAIETVWHEYLPDYDAGIPWSTIPQPLRAIDPGPVVNVTPEPPPDPAALTPDELAQLEQWFASRKDPDE